MGSPLKQVYFCSYSDDKDVPTVEYLRKQARGYLIRVATEALEKD
jgi:hypothetical protein